MKTTTRKKMDKSEGPQVLKALHAIASEIEQADDEVRASLVERGVPAHEIGGGQLGFFIDEIESIYKATKNPAFAYEIVATACGTKRKCLNGQHVSSLGDWRS